MNEELKAHWAHLVNYVSTLPTRQDLAPIIDDDAELTALRQQRDDLLNLLATALPYVEDAEESPLFRAGVVKKVAAEIRSAIAKAEGGAA